MYSGFLAAPKHGDDWPSDAPVALEAQYAAALDRGRTAHPDIRGCEPLFAQALGTKFASDDPIEWPDIER